MTITVKIDGKEYTVPGLKYKQLKEVWPRLKGTFDKMQAARASMDAKRKAAGDSEEPLVDKDSVDGMFGAVDDSIFIISSALRRDPEQAHMTPEWIEEHMDPSEATAFPAVIFQIMTATGLVKAGKLDPAMVKAVAGSLTGTGTPSSPNSSQPESKEAVGSA